MNPTGIGGMGTGNTNDQNRPSIFTDQYPPAVSPPLNWNDIPGTSQPTVGTGTPQSTGFDMQQGFRGFPSRPNFQFSVDRGAFGSTVQFPFRNVHRRTPTERPSSSMRCKRKTDCPSMQASKQFITEEKMAEHLSKLNISSETASEMESEEVKERRLYMCEEMKRFQAQNDPILPESILSRIVQPCTALVLWKPPEIILNPYAYNYREENSENNNNNYITVEQEEQQDVQNDMEFEEL